MHPNAIKVVDCSAQADCICDVAGARFKTLRRVVVQSVFEGHILNHVAPALPRRHVLQDVGLAIHDTDPREAEDLVSREHKEIAIQCLYIDLHSVTPQPNGTLLIKSLLSSPHGPAPGDLIARCPADARKENLSAPTDPTQQTTIKDPNVPFAFAFPDLSGQTVANTDPEFRGKVVIVAIGGSWCPNCHDEAPFLVSLYKKSHSRGLEIVNIDFETGDPDTDTPRLKAFIAHYGITYPVLLGGTTDQLAERIPQAVNLNCWPTSFFIGRDGLVKQTHPGFAGPGNTVGHADLELEVTALVEKLLAEPAAAVGAN